MMAIPPDLARLYESLLARKGVSVKERPYFQAESGTDHGFNTN
jgi:hypothetical protein